MRFFALLLTCGVVSAAVDHGPFVQWFHDPCHEAEIRWVDRGITPIKEGTWVVGQAGFGYGDGDDATVLASMQGRTTSLAIRKKIDWNGTAAADDVLVAEVLYDDGFVLFIDGKEVLRKHSTGSDATIKAQGKHEAENWERFPLGKAATLIKPGSIIAVQGVNDGIESSDFSLALALTIQGKKSTVLVRRHDTWQYLVHKAPEGNWKTEYPKIAAQTPVAARVYTLGYRIAGAGEWTWVKARSHPFANSADHVHAVSLTGLNADTRYEFSIADSSQRALSGPHLMQTAPETFRPMHFVIGGDMYHDRKLLDDMNRRCGAEDPLFAALIGDLAYANDSKIERWYAWIDSWVKHARAADGRLIPMVIGMGNHEVMGNGYFPEKDTPGPEMSTQFYSLFRMSQHEDRVVSYYPIDFGNYLSLILLDSGHTQRISEQVDFLKSTASTRRAIPFVFAAYHRPAWGTGIKEDAVDIQKKWCPLFEAFGIDAAFEHDHHLYKRTWPLTAGKRDDARGIPYLGDGAWGVSVRVADKNDLKKRPWIASQAALNHLIRVNLRKKDFTCEAKSADGKIIDQATYPQRP
jgi:hypothetical protein